MKRKIAITLALLSIILACNKEKQTVTPNSAQAASETTTENRHSGARAGDSSLFISQTDANQMISSYIASIGNDPNNTLQNPSLHALVVNADSLRAYLANSKIKSVKLIYAHTMSFINAGNYGKYAGNSANAMTIILAGVDIQGNFTYFGQQQKVLDHATPCPYTCPSGSAGNDLLQ